MSDFELFIGGNRFSHFTNGWVTRRMDTVADEFQFQYADLRTDLDAPAPVEAGDSCTITLAGETLLTGYVDDISIQYQADQLTLTARGRSMTGDLVDSSAIRKGGRWANETLERICNDLCEPFQIAVTVDQVDDVTTPFRRFAIDPGETVADVIQRACRLRGVWPTNTVDGGLHIVRAAKGQRALRSLEYGKNIISGERFDSWSMRHNYYLIKGQVPGDDEMNKQTATQISEFIVDDGIDRYRPLLMVSTGQDRKGDLRRRAQWERNRRAGTGERMVYRVDGYGYEVSQYVGSFAHKRRDSFRLWEPNTLVKVDDKRLRVDEWLLCSAVSYRWQAEGDDGGRTTDLTMVRKEAFDVEPYPTRRRGEKI